MKLQTVLEHSNIKFSYIDTPAGCSLTLENASDMSYVRELASSVYGFAIDESAEVASASHTLLLVDRSAPNYHDVLIRNAELADANDDTDEELEEDEEDEGEDEGGEGGDDSVGKKPSAVGDLEDRDLKVLTGPDQHKMLAKMYTGICNNSDMSKYPAFCIDMDKALRRYYVKPSMDTEFDFDGSGEEAAADNHAKECSCNEEATCEACVEEAMNDALVNEVATIVATELAKRKKKQKGGRAGLLSMMMKYISGDRGEALVKAWEAGDEETVQQFFSGLGSKLAANPPILEK